MSSSFDTTVDPDVQKQNRVGESAGQSATNGVKAHRSAPGRDQPMVNVQPPRREDLQPSYAQTLVGESDQGNHGWYGAMSM